MASCGRLEPVIHAQNTPDIALPNVWADRSVTENCNVKPRALKADCEGRAPEVAAEKPKEWPLHLNGRVCGETFPGRESNPGANGRIPL